MENPAQSFALKVFGRKQEQHFFSKSFSIIQMNDSATVGVRLWGPQKAHMAERSRHSPMDTSLMLSLSRNSSATDTFSSFICLKLGLGWYFLYIFLWLRTSSRAMSLRPSPRSNRRSPIRLLTHFRCSLIQRVKVFCWIFFHGASSARSFSVAGIVDGSSGRKQPPGALCARASAVVRERGRLLVPGASSKRLKVVSGFPQPRWDASDRRRSSAARNSQTSSSYTLHRRHVTLQYRHLSGFTGTLHLPFPDRDEIGISFSYTANDFLANFLQSSHVVVLG